MFAALKNREYRLLWIGQAISFVGDQFHLVALPWLVLRLTHDPLQLGLVLACAGVPRAVLMLVGGALSDSRSPRALMLGSDIVRTVATGALALAVLTGTVQPWMLYVLAIVFGAASGFFTPAMTATIPRLLPADGLAGGNALMHIVGQLAGFIGPAAAGVLIALFGDKGADASTVAGLTGIGVAQAIDAASFGASALALTLMRPIPAAASDSGPHPARAIADGLAYAWKTADMRVMLLAITIANFCVAGPILVGVPVLADRNLPEGATAFGILMSAYALGNLVGLVAAGSLKWGRDRLGLLAVGLLAAFGVALPVLGFLQSTWAAAALLTLVGVGNGYIGVSLITAIQSRTPKEMLGRTMALMMLSMVGLMPLSQAVAGVVLRWSVPALFVGAGAILLATAAGTVTRPEARHFSIAPLPVQAD